MKEFSMYIVCIFEIIYLIPLYHYTAVNKVLLNNKIIVHHINVNINPPRTLDSLIIFQELFHKNGQTIHLYCFGQY